MVLTRAFACALPVVASDIPGYREVTTPETSVTVPPDDPAALAEAITGLLADEPRRVGDGRGRARRSRSSSTPGATSPAGSRASTSARSTPTGARRRVNRPRRVARNPWARGILVLAAARRARSLAIWWRGPDWNTVYHAFDSVSWRWVIVGVLLNLALGARARRSRGG